MFTVELKSGYHRLDMREDAWPFPGLRVWHGQFYRFVHLPYGLSTACWAFTKVTREPLGKWRAAGNRCTGFSDDSLHAHSDPQLAHRRRCRLVGDERPDRQWLLSLRRPASPRSREKNTSGGLMDSVAETVPVPEKTRVALLSAIDAALGAQHRYQGGRLLPLSAQSCQCRFLSVPYPYQCS